MDKNAVRRLYILGGIVALFVLIVLVFIFWSYRRFENIQQGMDYVRGHALEVIPRELDLGELQVNEESTEIARTIELKNLLSKQVTVLGAKVDCSCVAVAGLPATFKPLETKTISLKITLSPIPSAGEFIDFNHHILFYLDTDSVPILVKITGKMLP